MITQAIIERQAGGVTPRRGLGRVRMRWGVGGVGLGSDVCADVGNMRVCGCGWSRVEALAVHHGDCPTRPRHKITYSDAACLVILMVKSTSEAVFGNAEPLVLTMLHQGDEPGIPLVPEVAILDFDQLLLTGLATDIG